MTIAERPVRAKARRPNVVAEIAARRTADVRAELSELSASDRRRLVAAAPPPRPIAERLAAPGLHLIAEVKRRSPSAGAIADPDRDVVALARAYEAGGATAISVLCEPHWFGGSIDDLRAIRAAVRVPVLAKDFVVNGGQLDLLRAAGADLVLLLASLHPAARLGRLVDRALEVGLEPLVEAHDERELDRALATSARSTSIPNGRCVSAASSPRIASSSPSPASGIPRPSPDGVPRASMPRSSARHSSGPRIRARKLRATSPRVAIRTISRTALAGRS